MPGRLVMLTSSNPFKLRMCCIPAHQRPKVSKQARRPPQHDACHSVGAGVLINAVMPNWLITVLLVLVLTWLTMKTFQKGWQLHSSEVATHQQQHLSDETQLGQPDGVQNDTESEPAAMHQNEHGLRKIMNIDDAATDTYNTVSALEEDTSLPADSTILDTESGQIIPDGDLGAAGYQQPTLLGLHMSWRVVQFGELSCLWAAFLGLQYGKVTFSECSWQYALLCCAQAIFSGITTGVFIFQAHSLRSAKTSDLQTPLLSERKAVISHHDWPMPMLTTCVFIVLFGGIVAGMLGFGGGMILNPLMLEMGINPLVSSATSSVMVLFSASAATFSFAISGRLNYQHAAVYGGVCAVASIVGVAIISTSVRRSGKGSRIVFTLAFIIATGALMQAVFGGSAAVHDVRTGHQISFLSLC